MREEEYSDEGKIGGAEKESESSIENVGNVSNRSLLFGRRRIVKLVEVFSLKWNRFDLEKKALGSNRFDLEKKAPGSKNTATEFRAPKVSSNLHFTGKTPLARSALKV